MAFIDNDASLHDAILNDLGLVIDETGKIVNSEMRKSISSIVYAPYAPEMYERYGAYGGFLGSWVSRTSVSGNSVESTIFSDPNEMVSIHPAHESPDGEDRRNRMTEIILSGTDYDYMYSNPDRISEAWWNKPRDFWTPVIESLDNGLANKIIEKEFKSKNIKFKK
jgi:hypothetical protein